MVHPVAAGLGRAGRPGAPASLAAARALAVAAAGQPAAVRGRSQAVRHSVRRSTPFGSSQWQVRTARRRSGVDAATAWPPARAKNFIMSLSGGNGSCRGKKAASRAASFSAPRWWVTSNMSRQFAVDVDTKSFQLLTSGKLAARICIRSEDAVFPDEGWNDFPIPILTWWLRELSETDHRLGGKCDMYFMDGPFMFTAEATSDPWLWRVTCVRRLMKESRQEWGIFRRDLLESAIKSAADTVIAACAEKEIEPFELDSLAYIRKLIDAK